MAKISLDWLRKEATPTSYQRGGRYYDNVGEITKSGNYYQAEVAGSAKYQVNIEESSIDVHGFCSCPYSGIGICKHIVAVGLNILDDHFVEVAPSENEVEFSLIEMIEETTPSTQKNNFYQDVFQRATADQQAQFLIQLFEQNATIRELFEQFIHPANTSTADYIAAQEIYQSIRHRLPLLEFQYESEHEIEAFRYENDDLNADNYAEVFAPFGQKVIDLLKEDNLSNALRILYGIYAAVQNLEQLDWRDYAVFADNLYDLKFPFVEWEITTADQLKEMPISINAAKTALALLFQSESFFPLTNGSDASIQFVPAQFTNVLRVLTKEQEVLNYLLTLLEEERYYRLENVHLLLYLLEKLKKQARWIEVSEDFASNSPAVAKRLLQYYLTMHQQEDFYRLARTTFDLFPNAVIPFLLKHVQPEKDTALAIDLLRYQTETNQDINAYRQLREYLTLEEQNDLLERNISNAAFYVKLLEVDQRYQDILTYVKERRHYFHISEMIAPILQIFPEESYEILTQRAIQDIQTGAQNRTGYKWAANNLKPILTIKGYEKVAKDFGKKLKKKYSNLPILVEELKAAGF